MDIGDIQYLGTKAINKYEVIVVSLPPVGCCPIFNIYWNPVTQKIVVEYDDEPKPA